MWEIYIHITSRITHLLRINLRCIETEMEAEREKAKPHTDYLVFPEMAAWIDFGIKYTSSYHYTVPHHHTLFHSIARCLILNVYFNERDGVFFIWILVYAFRCIFFIFSILFLFHRVVIFFRLFHQYVSVLLNVCLEFIIHPYLLMRSKCKLCNNKLPLYVVIGCNFCFFFLLFECVCSFVFGVTRKIVHINENYM